MELSFTEKKSIRKNFGKLKEILSIPNLIAVQKKSYEEFLATGKTDESTLQKGLSAVNSLRPVSFNWIDGFCEAEKGTLYGFIAQEAEIVDSNLIQPFNAEGTSIKIGDVDNPDQEIENALTVNEKFIIPMLVKAIQELSAKVDALESA